MKRPGSDGEIHRSFFVSWCSAGTRTRARRRPNREEKPDFRRASSGGAGREGEGENGGASSVGSPLRHHSKMHQQGNPVLSGFPSVLELFLRTDRFERRRMAFYETVSRRPTLRRSSGESSKSKMPRSSFICCSEPVPVSGTIPV